jgi:HAD superfamily hydrolase (TIGR01509 family)
MNVKAVIFDMDGVIIDSEPIESLAWEKVLAEYKRKPIFNSSGLIHEVGQGSQDDIVSKHNLSGEDLNVIRIKKRAFFEELIIKDLSSMSGMESLLEKIKIEKIKLAVASTRNERQVKLIINRLGFEKHFSVIVGFNEKIRRKPFPDVFLAAASELKISPSFCVAIEDSGAGVTAGKSAGMKVIAVPNKWTKHQDFSKADKIINSLSEITINVLKNL